jgi:hypothetical protein
MRPQIIKYKLFVQINFALERISKLFVLYRCVIFFSFVTKAIVNQERLKSFLMTAVPRQRRALKYFHTAHRILINLQTPMLRARPKVWLPGASGKTSQNYNFVFIS